MVDLGAIPDLVILWLAAFLPALVYLSWIRQSERYSKEAWGPLLRSFAYGAVVATVIAAIVEAVLVALGTTLSQTIPAPEFVFLNSKTSLGGLFLVLVIAPVVEEGLKASGVIRNRDKIRVIADGPVLGASTGLGFGFFETFLYGLALFLVSGLAAAIGLVILRSLSSVLLHGSSTGMFGYGYARSKFGVPGAGTGAYYLLAVGMHASFNLLASGAVVAQLLGYPQDESYAAVAGLVLAVLFAFGAIEHVRSLVRYTEYPALQQGKRPYSPPPGARRPPRGPTQR
ncbi:MAG TPA: PrsW family glutamic-type intramembrane protease [Thermoplasmata archaeon]|nr:PrsW family glutamic-type intramembrane protease [Thermoplasmata archaeon]